MPSLRIVLIGGGSLTWTPNLLTDLVLEPELEGSTAVLVDVDEPALERMQDFAGRLLESAGRRWKIEATTDRQPALQGADFVLLTITVGGLAAMELDLQIPEKYGICQSVGDTTGPGGLARALRNIPVILDIARDIERICPDAWLLQYTNPMTTLTRVITRETKVKTIGLCHELPGVLRRLRRLLDIGDAPIDVAVAGVNHLIWLLRFQVGGRDGYDLLRHHLAEHPLEFPYGGDLPGEATSVWRDRLVLKLRLFETFGVLPAAGDRHLAEFFPNILTDATRCGGDYGVELTTVEHRRQAAAYGRAVAEKMASGDAPIPLRPSGEAAAPIILALAAGTGDYVHVINLPNQGQVDNLPRGAVVETMARLRRHVATPEPSGELPPALAAVVAPLVIRQEMTVEAGLRGDRGLALQVLATDPLVRDFAASKPLLDELLRAHAALLPQF
jgi:alpha-galactosidase/6-phospho-beta-glucosidase family protein